MIKHTLNKQPLQTYDLTVTIPWEDIQAQYKKAFSTVLSQFEFEGFRKGKVPPAIGEKHIKKDTVYQQLIHSFIPTVYEEIIKKENLKPIVNPKINLIKAKENEAWELKITVAQKPDILLKDYKKKIQEIKAASKKGDIWVPGKDQKPPSEQDEKAKKDKLFNEVLTAILKEVVCDVSPLIIEAELNKRLSQLVDDVQKLGLTVDAYLQSKGLKMEQLKKQYGDEIAQMYKLEFILMEIADQEKITVGQEEIQKIFDSIKDEKEKASAQANSYFYASVLRKQKTLDYIIGL